jgi:hypothetical protein
LGIFVPLAQGIQVELVFELDNRILTNRLWFVSVLGGPTTGDLTTVGDGVATWAATWLLPQLSNRITFLGTRAYDATVPYPGPQVVTSMSVPGGISSQSHSANVAVKVSFQTFNPPGRWLNWNFLGGIPTNRVTLNTLSSSWMNNVRNAYVALLDVFSLFVYRWSATTAVENGIPLAERTAYRIDHISIRTGRVSQRRTRMNNPSP